MCTKQRIHKSNRGNILFLILLAVVLFAALSYAVTSSMRGGGRSASEEKISTAFSEVMNVVSAHRIAIQRMILSGIRPENISAYYPDHDGGTNDGSYFWQNTNCHYTSNPDHSCKLYHPQGAGLDYFQ